MSKMKYGYDGEKYATVDVYFEDAVRISAYYEDFDGDVKKWKNAVYEMFRWNMTYSFANKIDVLESRSSGVFLLIFANPKFEKNIVETMEDLGFRNIRAEHEDIGVIECTTLPEEALIDFAIVDY